MIVTAGSAVSESSPVSMHGPLGTGALDAAPATGDWVGTALAGAFEAAGVLGAAAWLTAGPLPDGLA